MHLLEVTYETEQFLDFLSEAKFVSYEIKLVNEAFWDNLHLNQKYQLHWGCDLMHMGEKTWAFMCITYVFVMGVGSYFFFKVKLSLSLIP